MSRIEYMQKAMDNPGIAIEVELDHFEYMLGVLPPVYAANAVYGLGEVSDHDGSGEPLHIWFVNRGDRYFCAYGTQAQGEKILSDPALNEERRG